MIAIAFVLGLTLGWLLCLHEQAAARMRADELSNVVSLDEHRRRSA